MDQGPWRDRHGRAQEVIDHFVAGLVARGLPSASSGQTSGTSNRLLGREAAFVAPSIAPRGERVS